MNSGDESRSTEAELRIAKHIKAIDKVLAERGAGITERRSVTNDVESQIRDMLAARSGQNASVADVEAVLAELDPPSSYAAAEHPQTAAPSIAGRLSLTAVAGAIWAPWAIIAFFAYFEFGEVEVLAGQPMPPPGPSTLALCLFIIPLLAAGLTSPFGTTACGVVAINQIRRSAGSLYGLVLALIDALFYPLLIVDILLGILVYHGYAVLANWHKLGMDAFFHLNRAAADENFGLIVAVTVMFSLIVDFVIARYAWRKVGAEASVSAGPHSRQP